MFEPRPAALAVSAALLGILFIAGCASRQPPRGGPQGRPPGNDSGPGGGGGALTLDGGRVARPVALLFTGMDTDRDYILRQDELAAGIVREWASLPQGAQGNVPAIAIADWAGTALGDPEALPNHLAFDVNLDGQVSETEFRARLTDEFAQLDRDHDGRLTRAEMLRDLPVRGQGQGGGMPSGGMQGGPPGGGRPPR
jgi:hypothetical protein